MTESSQPDTEDQEFFGRMAVDAARANSEADLQNVGTQAIIDLAVDTVWQKHIAETQPVIEQAWLTILSHVDAKLFNQCINSSQYAPRLMNIVYDDDEDGNLRINSSRWLHRKPYDTLGLVWHFENLQKVDSDTVLSRIELFVPESDEALKNEELFLALEGLQYASKWIEAPQYLNRQTKPHTVLGVQSSRKGFFNHAVALDDPLKHAVQNEVLASAHTILYNIKNRVLGRDDAWKVWDMIPDTACGEISVDDFSGDKRKLPVLPCDLNPEQDVFEAATNEALEDVNNFDTITLGRLVTLLEQSS